ncbi:Methyltransf_16 domain-containing protein [Cephalotus follicularis]|uniref:Methyltransf_16 domain-containing protein n=1 Tax=Cephalotus follicularis TaxID=3775 RepID=A0A1Q3C3B5_CEPFO|nr:Methyltransf_16 domain-containing protein [Cephalotus follicularis]
MGERRNNIEGNAGGDEKELSPKPMTTLSLHYFADESEKLAFSISIIENIEEEYGLYVWPCSVILAEYVWQQRLRFSGASVVELGAGTSLPGLVAAKVGADVTLTDNATRPEVLDNMSRVCDLNKLKCNVLGLTWGIWDASIFSLNPKIILGADVFYEASAFDDLFATVTFLLQSSPGSVFITTYHNRSGHHLIEFLMVKWGLKCMKLLDGFSFMPSYKVSGLSGNIQLAELALDRKSAEETLSSSVT